MPPDAPLLANGKRCSAADQCASGLCVDGYCCNGACTGTCQACHLTGSEGTCTPVPAGQDPRENCAQEPVASCGRDGTCDGQGACRRYPAATECAAGGCTAGIETAASTCDGNGTCRPGSTRNCAPNMCTGGSCAATCTSQTDCQTGFFCDGTRCTLQRTPGAACTMAFQCASGLCTDGVCCSGPCSQTCHACNVAGALGTCTAIPGGQDPQNECPAEAATTCGRAGGCNGTGGCRLHASGTSCGSQSCTGATETAGRTCNGSGVCVTGASAATARPTCAAATACGTSCTSSSQCKAGHYCSGNACVPFGAAPALYWKFDESQRDGRPSIPRATASTGRYTGSSGTPTASQHGPAGPLPRSRQPGVRRRQPPRRAPGARARGAEAGQQPDHQPVVPGHQPGHGHGTPGPRASEALSLGDNYFIRIRATDIAFTRRTAGGYVVCFAPMPSNHLDGNWHHVAGVLSPSGTKVYFDGVERGSNTSGANMIYDQGPTCMSAATGRTIPTGTSTATSTTSASTPGPCRRPRSPRSPADSGFCPTFTPGR